MVAAGCENERSPPFTVYGMHNMQVLRVIDIGEYASGLCVKGLTRQQESQNKTADMALAHA